MMTGTSLIENVNFGAPRIVAARFVGVFPLLLTSKLRFYFTVLIRGILVISLCYYNIRKHFCFLKDEQVPYHMKFSRDVNFAILKFVYFATP